MRHRGHRGGADGDLLPPKSASRDLTPDGVPQDERVEPIHATKTLTYILYLTCGWFAAHHLHLERHSHAFLWLTTWGGFGFGAFAYCTEVAAQHYFSSFH